MLITITRAVAVATAVQIGPKLELADNKVSHRVTQEIITKFVQLIVSGQMVCVEEFKNKNQKNNKVMGSSIIIVTLWAVHSNEWTFQVIKVLLLQKFSINFLVCLSQSASEYIVAESAGKGFQGILKPQAKT